MQHAVRPWPDLPLDLAALLGRIAAEVDGEPRHPRPWNLAALPDSFVELVWRWLEQVVRWINDQYAWLPETVIPPCWPQHPSLAYELAVLAFARQVAGRSCLPEDLRQWHEHLAGFHVRMHGALGGSGLSDCQRGKHAERPSAYELTMYDEAR